MPKHVLKSLELTTLLVALVVVLAVDALGAVHLPEDVPVLLGVLVDLELVPHRLALVALHEHVDVAVERGREQQGLAVVAALIEELEPLVGDGRPTCGSWAGWRA